MAAKVAIVVAIAKAEKSINQTERRRKSAMIWGICDMGEMPI